jgi:hypothetical protein
MISKEDVIPFQNKVVRVLYVDSGQELMLLGQLKNVSDTSLTIQTDFNLIVIPFNTINKVKCSLKENE